MVVTLSQLTTEGPARPFAALTATSVESPRTVVVMGATVTVVRYGRTTSRVRIRTGRGLSSCATWMGRIRAGRRACGRHARPGQPALGSDRSQPGSGHRGRRPRAGALARVPG